MTKIEAHRRLMEDRARDVGAIAARIPSGAVLVDYPIYPNVGDVLIYRGTEAALIKQGVTLRDRFSYPDLGKIRHGQFDLGRRFPTLDKLMSDCPMLVFQGGGNLGDLWPNHQLLRETLITRYPHVPCVILPQSAHFRDSAAVERCRQVFGSHPNLTVYCRDSETLALLGSSAQCTLAPDMAHALWLTLPRRPIGQRAGVLVQTRRDPESTTGAATADSFDWDDIQRRSEIAAWRGLITTRRLSALTPVRAAGDALWNALASRWVERAIGRLGQAERLDTDRLHGMILAALLETPVRFADNNYGKLSRYAACWFPGDPMVERR
jgi:pyruvyl transferase EpsO